MKRQGDLLIIPVKKIPDGCRPKKGTVIAEGEGTGHLHALSGGCLYEKNGTLYFAVNAEMEIDLTHPEHDTITFTPGIYKVVRQREYRPEGWRYVSD